MLEGTVSAGYLNALVEFAVLRGAKRERVLSGANLERSLLQNLDARLPIVRFRELLETAKQATGEPALALRFGNECDMADASVAGLIGRSAESVAEAFQMMNSYGRLLVDVPCAGPERFQLTSDGRHLIIVDTRLNPGDFSELTEFTFARFAAISRRMFPDRYYIREVHFSHPPPAYRDVFESVLGAAVFFESAPDRILADAEVLTANARLWQPRYAASILGAHADELLSELTRGSETTHKIEKLLLECLPAGGIGKRAVAQKFGMSVPTLHRRLKAEGTTFEQLLRTVQLKVAQRCLRAGMPVKQTAHMVGFSAATSFSRAFKRWTGRSPNSAR